MGTSVSRGQLEKVGSQTELTHACLPPWPGLAVSRTCCPAGVSLTLSERLSSVAEVAVTPWQQQGQDFTWARTTGAPSVEPMYTGSDLWTPWCVRLLPFVVACSVL